MPQKHIFDQQNIEFLVNGYAERKSISSLARACRVSDRTVQRLLISEGVYKKRQTPSHRKQLFSHNEHYFDEINNEEKAYWLGFIAADGCVRIDKYNRQYLDIRLNIKDAGHLRKLRSALKATNPIKFYTSKEGYNSNSCALSIASKSLTNGLISHGITPRKSATLEFPKLNEPLVRHFMRGYFDGDGCWTTNGLKYSKYSIIGSPKFILEYRKVLSAQCGVNPQKVIGGKSERGWATLDYGAFEDLTNIYDFMYHQSSVFMMRKKQKADDMGLGIK